MLNSVSILRVFDYTVTDVAAFRCIVKRNEKILVEYLTFDEIYEINMANKHCSSLQIMNYFK
jgi:hypothetical protein